MKTLEQIKNDYAVSRGYSDWENLITSMIFNSVPKSTIGKLTELEKHMDNICIIAQKECLKLASDNILIRPYLDGSIDYNDVEEQITNENKHCYRA